MSWVVWAILAIFLMGTSDLFRKLGSNLKDPAFANLIFQFGSFITAIVLFMIYRKTSNDPKGILFALIGGVLISIFTLISFKTLSIGPGVSTVMPVLRIGGITLVTILGIVILKEKFSVQSLLGIVFSVVGLYLLLSSK